MKFDIRDVRFDTISTSPAIRLTHVPTGIQLVENLSLSYHTNEQNGIKRLRDLVENPPKEEI